MLNFLPEKDGAVSGRKEAALTPEASFAFLRRERGTMLEINMYPKNSCGN
jgi:hypothetical protein